MPAKLPREIKEMRGTLQKCRDNTNSPKPIYSTPAPPKKLSKAEQKYFKAICQLLNTMKVLALSDVFIVELLAKALARDDQYSAELYAYGTTTYQTKTQTGEIKYSSYPQVAQQSENTRLIIQLLSKCGLSPVDRQNIHAQLDNGEDGQSDADAIIYS